MTTNIRSQATSAPNDGTPAHRVARFNVYAAFNDQSDAQNAVEALGRASTEGANISLKGPSDVSGPTETASADARLLGRWFWSVLTWAGMGSAVGFVFGALIGIITLGSYVDRDLTAPSLLVAGLLGAIGLGAVSALVAAMWYVQAGDAWEQSFHQEHGQRVIVGVHLDDYDAAQSALATLVHAGSVDTYVTGPRADDVRRRHELAGATRR